MRFLLSFSISLFVASIVIPLAVLFVADLDVNVVDKQRVSALHVATQQGNVAAVKLLLADRRLDVNCGDSHHITPLLMAASKPEKIEIFKPEVDIRYDEEEVVSFDLDHNY